MHEMGMVMPKKKNLRHSWVSSDGAGLGGLVMSWDLRKSMDG
jgi:hypothetical protein